MLTAAERLHDALTGRRPAHTLPGPLYHDPGVHALDLEHVWRREWVFAGPVAELAEPGDFVTLTVADHPLVIVRGHDGELRALHNVCRHRGSVLCEAEHGQVRRRFVCPYHQWSYELDGRLGRGRDLPDGVDPDELGLRRAHCVDIGGLVFVAVADDPPDPAPLRAVVEAYLAPFDLRHAAVAHRTTTLEQGNWKLVMENNRECFHCRSAHPELNVTFPAGSLHAGGGTAEELAALDRLVETCERADLPSRYVAAPDHQYRVMRMPFVDGARSMTMDGAPAVAGRFGELPDAELGDVLLYHYPSTWSHFMADHAVTFRILPVGPTTTELRTTWLVPCGSVAGRDYDLDALTSVWRATNAQDTALVERAQRGVRSPAYVPGPYAPVEEEGVVQFVDWYAATVLSALDGVSRDTSRPATRSTV